MKDGLRDLAHKLQSVLRGIWCHRWLGVGVAAVVGIVCAIGVGTVSDRYEASARLYVDTQTVLKPLMADMTVQPDIDQQVRMLAKTLVSRPNVERLLDMPGLAPNDAVDRETAVTLLTNKIKVEATGGGNLYTISYRDPDPQRAQRLVESLVDLFMNASGAEKKRDSEEAGRFIKEQIHDYEVKLTEAENRLKHFKLKNFGMTGVSNQDYFSRISALSDSINKLKSDLYAQEQARVAFQRELEREPPQLPPEQAAALGVPRTDAEERLEQQRRQLDDLLRRYTEAHPDVINARRIIGSLENQVRQEAEARAQQGAGKDRAAATSPVYQRIRISLAQTEADIASLRSRLATEQSRLEEARAMANRIPQVEAELAQLNRDYDVMRKNYEQLVNRRETASLGVKLDESAQLAEFRLVEPPRVTPTPIRPARIHLAAGAILASILAGLVAAYIAMEMRPTFTDLKTLQKLSSCQVLGSVSMFFSEERLQQRRAELTRFGVATSVLLLLQVAWVGWIYLGKSL